MSSSRDDFGIAFRSALLQRGAAQKFSLVFLLFLSSIIFILDINNFNFMKPIRSSINDGVYRFTLMVSLPNKIFPTASTKIKNLLILKKENIKLKSQLEIYEKKNLDIEFLTNQNKNLKQLLDSDKTLLDENSIIAKVLIDKSSPYLKSIIVNRGSKAGILKGMPVLAKDYLVGRVVETNYLSSRVLLLNDLNSRIPVTLDQNGTQAILKGTNKSKPTLEYLPEEYKVLAGINVFTSGKDGIFKAGSPVGVTNEKGEVKLYVDPGQLSFIKIYMRNVEKENF